jgi:peptidoglycan biosynthesis protein MviN/MurJ (putative lipid II flippase)
MTVAEGRVAGNAAITGVSTAAAMISGGVLALLVAVTIGNNASTDGFFAAFALYQTLVSFAQSARTTIVARLAEGERFAAFNRYLGAGLVVMVVVSVAFGPLGDPLARALTGDLPDAARSSARDALLILWPAAGLQLFAALGAAMLGALGDFLWAGVPFVAGGLLAIVAFLVLEPGLGIDALSVSLLVGSVLSAGLVGMSLVRAGWRPSRVSVTQPAASLRAGGILVISSLSFLLAQLGFVITISLAARLGVGVVTVFSYSNMAMGLVQALFVSSIPMVLAVPLATTWDRRPASLLPHHEAIFSAGLLLSLPVIAAAALVGDEVGRLVLASFTAHQVELVVELFVIVSANVVWGLVQSVPYAAMMGLGRYGVVAIVTAAAVLAQIVVAFVAIGVDSTDLLAASVPAAGAVSALAIMALVSPGYLGFAGPRLLVIFTRLVAAAALAFGVPALLPASDFLALLAGAVLFLALLRFLPERATAQRLLGMLRRAPAQERAGSSSARS